MSLHMPPGLLHLCAVQHSCSLSLTYFTSLILSRSTFYEADNLQSYKYKVPFFSLEKCFSTAKQAALTGSQTKNELDGELMSSLIYLVVTS